MSKYNLPEMMSYIIGALFVVIVFAIAYAYQSLTVFITPGRSQP
jgi:hypothetical protein